MNRFVAPLARIAIMFGGVGILAACGGEADLQGAPNVRGLALPEARAMLESNGFQASEKTDAMFGIIIPSHFTVCEEGTPNGKLVPITANKEC